MLSVKSNFDSTYAHQKCIQVLWDVRSLQENVQWHAYEIGHRSNKVF